MANTTITNLPLATSINGTEQIPAVQSSATVRLTVNQLVAFTSSTLPAPTVTIGGVVSGGTANNALYVSPSGTLGQFPYGTGVLNAIQIATGTNGAPVLFNGAGGTPTSLTLTLGSISVSGATNGYVLYNNAGLLGAAPPTAATLSINSPITGGAAENGLFSNSLSQLGQFAYGTGVRTALGVNVGSAGAPVLFNGAGGTPTSLTLTSATGLPLTTGVTGNLPVTNLNSGTGATASTFWCGNGSWAAVSGGLGTVTSVSFTGGIVTVNTPTAAASLVIAGTSGGIPYFSSGTTWASSAALTLNGVVYGGGAGASPVSTAAGTTGQVLIATTSNAPSWGQVPLATGVTGTLPVSNGGTGQSTALTQYGVIYGSSATAMGNTAAGTTGQVLIATTSNAPSWGQVSLTAGVTGSLPIGNGGTGQTTTALGTIVVGASGSTTTNLAIGTTSQVLTVSSGTAAWGQVSLTAGVTGVLPVANGGTNITSFGTGVATALGQNVSGSGSIVLGTSPTVNNPTVTNYVESVVAIGTVTTANTIALTNGTVQTATLTASTACTFTMPTATAGKSFVLLLKQAATTGNGTATFTSVKWGTAGAPTITATAGKMDILTFIADGTNWYGSIAQGYTP